jgi:S-DNA-T family DNA segregation ATPase FtsK/SpoIIIE
MPDRVQLSRPVEGSEARADDWLDRLADFRLHFGRFARDAGGVLLVAAALTSLLGLLGYTDGVLISLWTGLLLRGFGWGSYLIVLVIGFFGFAMLRQKLGSWSLGRLMWLELAALLTLALLSAAGGNSIQRAEAGLDGGRIGWGITRLLWMLTTPVGGTILLAAGWLLSMMGGLGLWSRIEARLLRLAGEAPPEPIVEAAAPPVEEEPATAPPRAAQPQKKKPAPLPPEFRTSLRAPEKKNEKPLKAPPRDEMLPPLQILLAETSVRSDERTINQTAGLIMKTLSEFGIPATVIGYRVGPAVTQFAIQPGFIKKGSDEEDAQQMKVRRSKRTWRSPFRRSGCASRRPFRANPTWASRSRMRGLPSSGCDPCWRAKHFIGPEHLSPSHWEGMSPETRSLPIWHACRTC